jgi:FtsH-binding integral membrane protein
MAARAENAPLLGDGGHINVFESASTDDKTLPDEIRVGFIKKTYGLLTYMLVITFAIATPFIFNTRADVTAYMVAHPWIPIVTGVTFLGLYLLNFCVMISMFCSGELQQSYLRMFKTFPQNIVFMTVVSSCFGVLMGFICLQYTAQSVLLVFALCACIIAGLTVYAVKTKADFTGMGPYIFVAVLGLMFTGLICSFFVSDTQGFRTFDRIMGGIGSMIFGFIIVYDTQLIFGNSKFTGGERGMQFTIDMYAFAAYHLYLDFINFLIYM